MPSLHSANPSAPIISSPNAPMAAQRALRMLESLTVGGLSVDLPDGRQLTFGAAQSGPQASMRIHDWQVFALTMRSGDIGFAESYIAKQWDTPDLTSLLQLLVANRRVMDDLIFGTWWGRLAYQVRHWTRRNTKKNSSKNIHAHYDLGNGFYSLWLDPSMSYSSAWFDNDYNQPLIAAQHAKVRRALRMAGVQAGQSQRVLEIGCGWGGLAEIAARECGAKVTGITLSPAQLAYASERLGAQSLHADLRLQDYRDTDDGPYDAICSIEMIEAVGRA